MNSTLLTLSGGACEEAFGQELGFSHYKDHVYGFESAMMPWQAWNGALPQQTNEEAFCGHHALYVSSSEHCQWVKGQTLPKDIAIFDLHPKDI